MTLNTKLIVKITFVFFAKLKVLKQDAYFFFTKRCKKIVDCYRIVLTQIETKYWPLDNEIDQDVLKFDAF